MLTIASIQRRVAEHYGLRVTDMTSPERTWRVSHPRQVAMFLALTMTPSSKSEIGRRFGGRDHTTVLHAERVVPQRLRDDPKLRRDVRTIHNALREAEADFVTIAGIRIRRDALPSFPRAGAV